MLIVQRAKLYYTVSGIITPIGGRPVHRLREDSQSISVLKNCPGKKDSLRVFVHRVVKKRPFEPRGRKQYDFNGIAKWQFHIWYVSAAAYRGGGLNPPHEIPKALQNRAKLNPIVKTVKNS